MTTRYHPQSPSVAYNVNFFTDVIHTTVTHDPNAVAQWIHDTIILYGHRLIVGLDIEWLPNLSRGEQNPTATLQLCVGRCCLIYQLIHSPYLPLQLIQFLSSDHTFVGVGIKSDLEKLNRDYQIGYNASAVDLRDLAAALYRRKDLKNAGLKTLARLVLGKNMDKPKSVARSNWDDRRLTAGQVSYACIDAFVSFEVGSRMLHYISAFPVSLRTITLFRKSLILVHQGLQLCADRSLPHLEIDIDSKISFDMIMPKSKEAWKHIYTKKDQKAFGDLFEAFVN